MTTYDTCACGARKQRRSALCRPCRDRVRRRKSMRFLVQGFNAFRFGQLLDRGGWTAREVEEQTGVSRKTIQNWREGKCLPLRLQYERVAKVLALIPCTACDGTGYRDGSPWLEKQRERQRAWRRRLTHRATGAIL